MIVSFNWLKEFVDIEGVSIDDFSEQMTMSGTKVEGIDDLGINLEKIVVGRIESIEKHPNADKLVITKINIGTELLQIVTGADNIKEGDFVPVALVGSLLKELKIKKSKLRGIESCGMLCSSGEMGMNTGLLSKEDNRGIYIFKKEYSLGIDVKPLLGLDDQIIDFELTANRPDCMSVIGLAREVSATYNKHLILPIIETKENKENIEDYLKVTIKDTELCSRYVTRMFKVNKIKPSPTWMQIKLLNCGVRPINNIVDVTNYVMLEMGQPLHAFDYDKLQSKEILVRRAEKGEELITLDSVNRKLDEEILVITNGQEPMAIAGVMGGENSEIDDSTKMIVIESAVFNKTTTRLTGKKLGLRSEAATRFEKGVDQELSDLAADRAAQLLYEIGAGEVVKGKIDIYPQPINKRSITIEPQWINKIIGIELTVEEIKDYLERLFLFTKEDGDKLVVGVPTYRQDLVIKEDIAEEVARMYGYNNIPNTIMRGVATEGRRNTSQEFIYGIKNLLSNKGFYEILTYSFTSKNKLEAIEYPINDEIINLLNPLGEENAIMRPTLIPGLLQTITHNYHRNISEAMFYEVAITYKNNGNLGEKLPLEEKTISLGLYGNVDFFNLKGYIEMLLKHGRISENIDYIPSDNKMYHPYRSAKVIIGDDFIGTFGEIHPEVVERFNLPLRTFVAELNLDMIMKYINKDIKYEELPKYPEINRDMALIVKNDVSAKEIETIIRKDGRELLEDIDLFDVYTGKQIPEGYKSIAYSLTFRAKERTLRDEEINDIFDNIIKSLESELNAKLRE